MTRIAWEPVIARAITLADDYEFAPTLRQVFYRLVAAGLIPNTNTAYKRLSHLTAIERRMGRMSPLADGTRAIERPPSWTSPARALRALAAQYRLDRSTGQNDQQWVVLEKATLSALARSVAYERGVPVAALRGYGSQTLVDDVAEAIDDDGRPAVIVYVGDYDPTGLDISRDLLDRLRVEVTFERVAVTNPQLDEYRLVPAPAKATDPRSASMLAAEGVAVQVEAEAIEPAELQRLIAVALDRRIDRAVLDDVIANEDSHRSALRGLADDWSTAERD